MIFFPGHLKNRFHQFEITYTTAYSTIDTCEYDEFVTNSQIKLGMKKSAVLLAKGNNYLPSQNKFQLTYVIDNMERSEFLKTYNIPYYFMTYDFDEFDKVKRIFFGFEYP